MFKYILIAESNFNEFRRVEYLQLTILARLVKAVAR